MQVQRNGAENWVIKMLGTTTTSGTATLRMRLLVTLTCHPIEEQVIVPKNQPIRDTLQFGEPMQAQVRNTSVLSLPTQKR